MTFHKKFRSCHSSRRSSISEIDKNSESRSGIITFWAIVSIPIFLCVLCVVLEVGNLWLARIQLKNALESAALAGVKHWGDNGGGDTQASRIVGNAFASSLVINGTPVDLSVIDNTLNYDVANSGNQNETCDGLLVFGSIIDDSPEYVFDACETAGCGLPFVIAIDVTSHGNLNSGNNNEWGISIQPTQPGPSTVSVRRVIFQIPAGENGQFEFINDFPEISSNDDDTDANNKVKCISTNIICPGPIPTGENSQADVFGVDPNPIDVLNEIKFFIDVPFGPDGMGRLECVPGSGTQVTGTAPGQTSKTLAVEFCDENVPGCDPFDLGDRIRFGAEMRKVMGGGQHDADDVGDFGVLVTVCLSDGTFLQGMFTDTTHSDPGGCDCASATFPFWGNCPSPRQGLTIHPAGIPDIPCPSGPAANNNGQSLVNFNVSGGSGLGFAVRAQASYDVPSICKNVFGIPIGPFCVTAKADALYECTMDSLRIYHLDDVNFLCSDPINCP